MSASVAVTDAAGGEEQAGEHDRVGGDDPLQLGRPGAQSPTSRGMATLMMVWSIEVTRRARTSTPRMRQRWGWLVWVSPRLGGGTAVHDDSWLVGGLVM